VLQRRLDVLYRFVPKAGTYPKGTLRQRRRKKCIKGHERVSWLLQILHLGRQTDHGDAGFLYTTRPYGHKDSTGRNGCEDAYVPLRFGSGVIQNRNRFGTIFQ